MADVDTIEPDVDQEAPPSDPGDWLKDMQTYLQKKPNAPDDELYRQFPQLNKDSKRLDAALSYIHGKSQGMTDEQGHQLYPDLVGPSVFLKNTTTDQPDGTTAATDGPTPQQVKTGIRQYRQAVPPPSAPEVSKNPNSKPFATEEQVQAQYMATANLLEDAKNGTSPQQRAMFMAPADVQVRVPDEDNQTLQLQKRLPELEKQKTQLQQQLTQQQVANEGTYKTIDQSFLDNSKKYFSDGQLDYGKVHEDALAAARQYGGDRLVAETIYNRAANALKFQQVKPDVDNEFKKMTGQTPAEYFGGSAAGANAASLQTHYENDFEAEAKRSQDLIQKASASIFQTKYQPILDHTAQLYGQNSPQFQMAMDNAQRLFAGDLRDIQTRENQRLLSVRAGIQKSLENDLSGVADKNQDQLDNFNRIYNQAYQTVQQKNEDAKKLIYDLPTTGNPTAMFLRSIWSGLNSWTASRGAGLVAAGFGNPITDWMRSRQTQAEKYAPPEGSPLNPAVLAGKSGQVIGSMLPDIAATALTKSPIFSGLELTASSTVSGMGDVYNQAKAEGLDEAEAQRRAQDFGKKNFIATIGPNIMMGSGILGNLSGLGKFLANTVKEGMGAVVASGAQQYLTQAESQNAKPLGQFLQEDAPKSARDNLLALAAGAPVMRAIGHITSAMGDAKTSGIQQQFYSDLIDKQGPNAAHATLELLYLNGLIDANGLAQGKKMISDLVSAKTGLSNFDVHPDLQKLYLAKLAEVDELEKNRPPVVEGTLGEAMQKMYDDRVKELQGQAKDILGGNVPYMKITSGTGTEFVLPIDKGIGTLQNPDVQSDIVNGHTKVDLIGKPEEVKPAQELLDNIQGKNLIPEAMIPGTSQITEVRHAITPEDKQGVTSGPTDIDLSAEGRNQADELAQNLQGQGITRVVGSETPRNVETAQRVSQALGVPAEQLEGLNAWKIGDFDKMPDTEFRRAETYFVNNPDATEFEGKKLEESFNQYKDRVIAARQQLEDTNTGHTLLVNHGGNINIWDAYQKNGGEWTPKAGRDYLAAKDTPPAEVPEKMQSANDLGYTPNKNLSPEHQAIETKFGTYLHDNYEEARAKYLKKFGNVINTDNARELSPDYEANRNELSSAVHEPASAFVKRVYADLLKQKPESGIVLFTAGGTGAGKTSAIENSDAVNKLSHDADITYDSNMNGATSAVNKIDQALASGRKAVIAYTYRDPIDAFENGVIPRMKRIGRSVPIEEHINTHKGSLEAIPQLAEYYKDNPNVEFINIDNSKGRGKAEVVSFGDIEKKAYFGNDVKDKLYESADQKLAAGDITQSEHNGLTEGRQTTDEGRTLPDATQESGPASQPENGEQPQRPGQPRPEQLTPEQQQALEVNTARAEREVLRDVINMPGEDAAKLLLEEYEKTKAHANDTPGHPGPPTDEREAGDQAAEHLQTVRPGDDAETGDRQNPDENEPRPAANGTQGPIREAGAKQATGAVPDESGTSAEDRALARDLADRLGQKRDRLNVPVGEKTNSEDQYLQKATAVLHQLFPDHQIRTYDTEAEYMEKEGRPAGSAGVYDPKGKYIAFNMEAIRRAGAENTIFHEVIHPIVQEALQSRPGAVDAAYSKLVDLKDIPGMENVWAHEEQYRGRGLDTMKVEAITEFLTHVADGRIDLDSFKPTLRTRIIDVINRIFKALGIDKVISTAQDISRLADSIKEAFTEADATPIKEALGKPGETDASGKMDKIIGSPSGDPKEDFVREHLDEKKESSIKKALVETGGMKDADAQALIDKVRAERTQSPEDIIREAIAIGKSSAKTAQIATPRAAEEMKSGMMKVAKRWYFDGRDDVTDVKSIIRKRKGMEEYEINKLYYETRKLVSWWNRVPREKQMAFILGVEKPELLNNQSQHMKDIASQYRQRLDKVHEIIKQYMPGLNFIQDYFPHFWENPEAARKVFAESLSKVPLEGSKSFAKQRFYDTIVEGLKANLKLATTNPEEMVRLAEAQAWKFKAAHNILSDMNAKGLVKISPFGEGPEGWKTVDDPIFQNMAMRALSYKGVKTTGTDLFGQDIKTEPESKMAALYMPPDVATLMNRYLSMGIKGKAADAVRYFNNVKNQLQLGFSQFHFVTTSVDASVSGFGMGIQKITSGNLRGLLDLATLGNLQATIRRGITASSDYNKGNLTPDSQHLADVNARVNKQKMYSLDAVYNMKKAFWHLRNDFDAGRLFKDATTGPLKKIPGQIVKNEDVMSAVKMIWNAAMVVPEIMNKPLMEHYVPWLKVGGYLRALDSEISARPNMTPEELQRTKEKLWDDMDNRLGQVVYDNVFMNKAAKDLGFMGIRSLGWTGGTIRAIAGGVGEIPLSMQRLAKGQGLTQRTAYLLALPLTVGAFGGMLNYALSGQPPQELEDYFFPWDGTYNPDGTKHRVTIPSYIKDILAYSKSPGKTIVNKTSPIIGDITDIYKNKDFYGEQIRNEDDPWYQQGIDILKYEAQTMQPFSFRKAPSDESPFMDQFTTQGGLEKKFGVMDAPKERDRSDVQNAIMDAYQKQIGHNEDPKTHEEMEQMVARKHLKEFIYNGGDYKDASDEWKDKAALDPRHLGKWIQDAKRDPYENYFKSLHADTKLKLFNQMSDEDKQKYGKWIPVAIRNKENQDQ
jgi:broad specificity phosphatase PhoE